MLNEPESVPTALPNWRGRFPQNDILSLLTVNRPLNLAESTSQDLTFGELVDLVGLDALHDLRLGYGAAEGLPRLREAVGTACGVPADLVITTTGTALGLYLMAIELCRPGDDVVLLTPCFPPSRDALIGAGVMVREMALRFEDGFRVDLERFAAALSPTTRMVSIASPQNPSGVATDAATIDAMLDLMAQRAPDAMLCVDETYRASTYGLAEMPASVAGRDPRLVTGASVSKAHGAPGLRVGWLTVPAADLRARLVTAKMNVVISGSPLTETLAAHLLEREDAVLAPRRALLIDALCRVEDWVASEATRVEWVRPNGGALCCVRLREDIFDRAAVARFLGAQEPRDLQLASGDWFGADARTFRLGFGYLPLDVLPRALASISATMDDALMGAEV